MIYCFRNYAFAQRAPSRTRFLERTGIKVSITTMPKCGKKIKFTPEKKLDTQAKDVEVALQTTQKYGLQGLNLLCCGNFGRTELLLVAAQKLSRPELGEMALQRAACVVARAEQTGY